MRQIFLLLALILSGSVLSSSNNPEDIIDIVRKREKLAIKVILDSVISEELKNKKFGVLIFYEGIVVNMGRRPGYVIAWFKYNTLRKYIMVDYLLFPSYENFSDFSGKLYDADNDDDYNENISDNLSQLYMQKHNQFIIFLNKIINYKNINIENVKQLKMRLPVGLQNDILFEKMRNIDKPIHGLIDEGDFFYWGFKSDSVEFIRSNQNYRELQYPDFDTWVIENHLQMYCYHVFTLT